MKQQNPKFETALVRRPTRNFSGGITTANLGTPDFGKVVDQHDQYCQALTQCGLIVIQLEPDDQYPDACFVEDTAVVIGDLVLITNPGHQSRKGESEAVERWFRATGKPLVVMDQSGLLDGGDVLKIGSHFHVGLSSRTNEQGAKQLGTIAESRGFTWSQLRVHNLLHLKTGVTCIDDCSIICVPELALSAEFSGIQNKIVVDDTERSAANCLVVNDVILVPAECVAAQQRLSETGKRLLPIDISEFQKMDGGLTCLSIRF